MTTPAPPLPDPAATAATAAPAAPAPKKRGRWFWPLQVVPPLLLIYLLWTDNGPGFYFSVLALALVAMLCLLSVLLRVVFLLFRRGDWRRLTRPLLAIAIFAFAMAYVQKSLREAKVVAAAEAAKIQAECDRAGRCPDGIAVGTGDNGHRRSLGTPSTHLLWPISYHTTDPGFVLELLATMDTTNRWTGGPGATLEYENLIEGEPASEFYDD